MHNKHRNVAVIPLEQQLSVSPNHQRAWPDDALVSSPESWFGGRAQQQDF